MFSSQYRLLKNERVLLINVFYLPQGLNPEIDSAILNDYIIHIT